MIPADEVSLEGDLQIPEGPHGVVIFAHGSGSSRLSARNRFVADRLVTAGFATLLFDLLTRREGEVTENRFDIELLAERLASAVRWAHEGEDLKGLRIGLFGASTGAAAALQVADLLGAEMVGGVVSRGGRPDLAAWALKRVFSPTLLIVGGADRDVIALNEQAFREMPAVTVKRMEIVPGAAHLFEEPGTLDKVADLAIEWFKGSLVSHSTGFDSDLPQRQVSRSLT